MRARQVAIGAMSAPERRTDVFDGVLIPPASTSTAACGYKYYQDRNRKWPFHTNAQGAALLEQLFDDARRVIAALDAAIATSAPDDAAREAIVRSGVDIYAKKPSIRERDVTWSQTEYAHLGLQREYCRFKSVQRFTETWACLERARARGVFEDVGKGGDGETRRVASLGGGPGFELVAVREFFKAHFPSVTLDLVSLDLEESWRASAEALGLRFFQWDMRSGKVAETCGGAVDFALASYVYKMYMCEDDVADWFADELKDMHAAFIISRDQSLKTALMEKRGVDVRKLMALQTQRGDDRQLVFSRDRVFEPWSTSTKSARAPESSMTFPNVPYEEHKTAGGDQHRDRDRQRGFRGGWDRRDQAYVAPRDADRVGKSRDSSRW